METLYLSGYTRQTNKGIHTVKIDLQAGKILHDTLLVAEQNPTYLALSADNRHLYTLTEKGDAPGVNHYLINDNDEATFVDHVDVFPGNGCYIAIDDKRQVLYLADYHNGSLATVTLDAEGKMTLSDIITHEGSGPHENQEKAHAHFFNAAPGNDFVYSCDLGTDEVHTYALDKNHHLIEKSVYHATPGTGPRHLAFHPSEPIAYLVGELSYTVDVLEIQADGSLQAINRYQTIPEDWNAFNSSSAIRITQDAQFLYVSNRGHNSLTAFKISADGKTLAQIQTTASHGDFPRDFNFTKDEALILVGHQKENALTLFKRDSETGLLTEVANNFPVDEIVCVAHQN